MFLIRTTFHNHMCFINLNVIQIKKYIGTKLSELLWRTQKIHNYKIKISINRPAIDQKPESSDEQFF